MEHIFRAIDAQTDKYLDFLCDICAVEARAKDKPELDSLVDLITAFAKAEGFCTERNPMENCGDFLTVDLNPGAPKAGLMLAHLDTVHDKGVFGENPVTRTPERITAPGVIDCKGGAAIALLAMKALKDAGYDKHLRLLLTSDEEVSNSLGGQAEIDYFTEKCSGFPCAINCETTEGDEVVISRKGIVRLRLDIQGLSGHSGIHYFECKNAIKEAAHKILALEGESTPGGITYSCNIIGGGSVTNIIPDHCSVTLDIRLPRHADMAIAEQTVQRIADTSFIQGTSATVTVISRRPPMEKNADTQALFDKFLSVCQKYGLGSLTGVESGGGSDSCYTQAAGVPSICGMGGSGAFCHTNNEFIDIASVPLRAKILAAYFAEE